MAAAKEIRGKIKSVENTKKITKAMEMVAASKMRKAQDRMFAARPYSDTVRILATHLAAATPEYVHPYMVTPAKENLSKKVGIFVVSTDKGLCGGLNTNVFRILTNKFRELEDAGNEIENVVVGQKGHAFLNRIGAKVVAQVTQIGDVPRLERLIGPAYTILNAYMEGKMDAIYLCYTKFINTMKQEAVIEQLLPLTEERMSTEELKVTAGHSWEYIYEPEPKPVIDELLERYIEALIFQSVAENIASEQSARMVAMKSASDNAGSVISELKLVYNKTRQAAITKELSEIVGGAAAV